MPDSMYVTLSRRPSIVGHLLHPRRPGRGDCAAHSPATRVLAGPAEGAEPANWKLKSSEELLDLKVCDMAMGSGAFLVATCRYLSARLARSLAESKRQIRPAIPQANTRRWITHIASRGQRPRDSRSPSGSRLLSLRGQSQSHGSRDGEAALLWLVTLAKDRPFSFL